MSKQNVKYRIVPRDYVFMTPSTHMAQFFYRNCRNLFLLAISFINSQMETSTVSYDNVFRRLKHWSFPSCILMFLNILHVNIKYETGIVFRFASSIFCSDSLRNPLCAVKYKIEDPFRKYVMNEVYNRRIFCIMGYENYLSLYNIFFRLF